MRLGLFMMPVHPPGRVLADTLAEDEEKALYADRLGFDELWLGEHFSATTEPIPAPLMFRAAHQESHLRHRRDLPAKSPPGQSGGRGRAIRSHEPRPLHARHRNRRTLFGFRIVRQ